MIIFIYSLNFHIRHSLKPIFFPEIATLFLLNLLLCGSRFLKRIINFSGLIFRYHRLAIKNKLILPLEKFFKTLKDMITGTLGRQLFESFTTFQSGQNIVVEI